VPLGEGLVGWVGLHGETLLANDVETEPRYLNPYPDHLPTRSELSVPIRIGDEIVGVLDLQSPQLNAFTLSDVTTEETLASQVAVAINNARLYSEAERRNRDLSLLNQVIAATAAAASLGVTSMLNVICRELVRAFEVPQSAAVLLEEGKQNAVVVAEYLTEARRSALGTNIPLNDNPMYLYLKENKTPLVIEDAEANLRIGALHDLVHMRGTASLLIVPLLVDGEVEGGLVIEFLESRHFSARDVDLARRVAEQVSSFLARARLEEQRQQLEEQFLQAQKLEAVGRLAGGIAHDFNNLLTIIHLSTRLMERQLHPEDPLAEQVRRIQDADRRATGLTQQLLAFSRREIVEPHLLDLNEVITNLNPMLRRIIGEDVELRSILARDLWTVKIDPSQMDQVLFNLAVNARDAMPTGGRLIVETANVILDRAYTMRHLDVEPGEYVLLSISDTGEGMDEEVKAHIFEPFFTTKEKGKGTGLGLATVHGIVKQNQGHIWVYSELGVGTTFKIYLPHVSEGVRAPTALPVEGVAAQGTETLLLVEDEAEVRELTRDILAALGYQVLMAEDGVQALQVAAEHDGPIHLLLTDVVMPGMSGRTLADELLSSHPEMRVLYVSGYTDNAIVHHGVLTEGTNFLSKPFDLETLAHRVRTVLDGQA
jgi:signal transduction histidine kinase/ActR/RegA family two-component response regulator